MVWTFSEFEFHCNAKTVSNVASASLPPIHTTPSWVEFKSPQDLQAVLCVLDTGLKLEHILRCKLHTTKIRDPPFSQLQKLAGATQHVHGRNALIDQPVDHGSDCFEMQRAIIVQRSKRRCDETLKRSKCLDYRERSATETGMKCEPRKEQYSAFAMAS